MSIQKNKLGVTMYSIRDLTGGVSKLVNSTIEDGVSFITKYGHPVVISVPVSPVLQIKALKKFKKLIEENKMDDEDKKVLELLGSISNFIEKIKH